MKLFVLIFCALACRVPLARAQEAPPLNEEKGKTVNSKIARNWRWLGAMEEDDRYAS